MAGLGFLRKLSKEGKLKIVEPSDNISKSYTIKSENCLRAAKVLQKVKLRITKRCWKIR